MVIKWQKAYIGPTVHENIKTFTEAAQIVEDSSKEYRTTATDINLYENNKHIASLRIIK